MLPQACPARLFRHARRATALTLLFVLVGQPAGQVYGQAPPAPTPPGSVVRPVPEPIPRVDAPLIIPPTERVLPAPQPQIAPPVVPPVEEPAPPPAGPPVRVDRVRIEGVTVYDEASLRALYAGVVGAAVPRSRLDDIVQELQARYREDGYILTLVRGDFQRSGAEVVFVIRATEGYIRDVKLDGDIGPAGELVLQMLRRLTAKRPVNNSDLERYLLLANDIPGVRARAFLRREGGDPGAVLLVAQLARKEVSGLLNYDNRGPREAGPSEVLLSGAANSFTNFGERTEALFFNTFNREQIFGQVNLSGFLGDDGLRARAYYGHGNSVPGGILAPLGYEGGLQIGGASVLYPVVRSRRLNFFSDIGVDTYNSSINLRRAAQVQGSNLWIARIGSTVDFQDSWFFQTPAATALNVRVSHGFLGTSATRTDDDVHFSKTAGDLTRVQDLFTFGDVRTALKTSVGGQYTQDILPPSEKFFLGGTRFGRGFYNGQVTGDRAVGASVEVQANTEFSDLPFADPAYRLPMQFYTFWDYGYGFNIPASKEPNHKLESVGLGFRSDVTPWLFLELEGVRRLTTRPQGTAGRRESGYAVFTRVMLHY